MGNTPIVGPITGNRQTIDAFLAANPPLRTGEVSLFLDEMFRLGELAGYDAFMIVIQSMVETANFRSPNWNNYLNPGAIGVTDSYDYRHGWKNGTESARVMLVHMAAYTGVLPDALAPYVHLDPRYDVARRMYGGTVQRWSDLGRGRWATDPKYYEAIMTREQWVRQYTVEAPPPPPATGSKAEQFVALAQKQVGKPYVWGTQGPNTFDCSGLVAWCASQVGLSISPDSHAQFNLGVRVDRQDLRAGDLLFYDTMQGGEVRGGNTASHVGIYVSPGVMVNALNANEGVVLSDPFSSYFAPLYLGARRVFAEQVEQPKPKEIVLPFPVYQTIVPKGQVNQRPGTKQTPKWVVQHETANYKHGAGAKMHSEWLLGGAQGHPNSQVSVHFFVDDKACYQMLPLDEVSYNAGCGACEGNYGGISIELCVNSDSDYEVARRNAAMLSAKLLVDLGLGIDRYSNHQNWSGKWCPALILNRGLWQNQKELVATFMEGATPSLHAKPSPLKVDGVEWDGMSDITVNGATFHGEVRRVNAIAGTPVLQYATWDARTTRDPLNANETIDVLGWVQGEERDGESRWWVSKYWSRIWVGGTVEKPKSDEPSLPENPDLPGVPSGPPKIINGRRVYLIPNGRVVTAERDITIYQFADPMAPVIRTVEEGGSFVARYWMIGPLVEDEVVWWIDDNHYAIPAFGTNERPA